MHKTSQWRALAASYHGLSCRLRIQKTILTRYRGSSLIQYQTPVMWPPDRLQGDYRV
jgi:hypothetical protein